jgi:branched-chain amino acid transport system ATP-binding protein
VAGHGDVSVLHGLDLRVAPGSVLAILGPNGAGKSTLLLTLAGLLPRLGGEVRVGDELLPSGKPAAARSAGVVLVPDDRALFTTLTVRENLGVARDKASPQPEEMLPTFPSLEKRWNVKAGALSGGEQQMLALARALIQRPAILLIDEMSMGLAPVIVEELLRVVRDIANETGTVVVLVEQHARLALEIADEALVLVHGAESLRGSARDLAAHPSRLEAAYLGTTVQS